MIVTSAEEQPPIPLLPHSGLNQKYIQPPKKPCPISPFPLICDHTQLFFAAAATIPIPSSTGKASKEPNPRSTLESHACSAAGISALFRAGAARFAAGGWRLTCAKRFVRASWGWVRGKADVERIKTEIRIRRRGRMVA